ncbi:GNAT family N-acetyltransferase [Pedobacter gandavensis]|uniref:GNAT family N-acetyltransferase n=1 Tax=Pedobacter gandavensis TaxID=2679963 RepID=A0ABR6ET73_9SPHI|nr:GNAT family N-acetyltransferase [Pedobacter gandavensis]MBB2148463.1 GNAT family N-acetyltransferase [Pedobacter gandavensis]
MAYHLINIEQSAKWDACVHEAVNYDFYHTWHYHALEKNGEPLLFVYEEAGVFIALPLLKREINNSGLYDLTSVYGYSGPISNRNFKDISDQMLDNFKQSFLTFMKTSGFISLFSRLNPFIDQKVLIEKIGGLYDNGKTVYIDLSVSIEDQRAGYEKRLGRQIRQLRKMPFQIKETSSAKEIRLFTAMYTENMLRLGASPRYFYDESYFIQLLTNNGEECKLIVIYDGEEMICGAVIMCAGNVIRNHLSATADGYVHYSPSKLLTDEISVIGRQLGKRYFHLGGGLEGKEDSLFKFKNAFSTLLLPDSTWRFVSDSSVYNDLVKERNNTSNLNYFPLYRVPAVALK